MEKGGGAVGSCQYSGLDMVSCNVTDAQLLHGRTDLIDGAISTHHGGGCRSDRMVVSLPTILLVIRRAPSSHEAR